MTKRFAPWIVFSAFFLYLTASAVGLPLRSGGFNLTEFRRLPVSVQGRVQPFDSAARMALLRIRGSATVPLDGGQAQQSRATALDADQWLLEVLAKPDLADTRKIFPVDNRDLLARLSLKPAARGTTYCAFRDFASEVGTIGGQTQRIAKLKAADRAAWERDLLALQGRLVMYERLKNSVQPNSLLQREAKGKPVAFDFAGELASYRTDLAEAVRIAARRKSGGTELLDPATEQRIRAFSGSFLGVSRIGLLGMIPPLPADSRDHWNNTGTVIIESARGGRLPLPVAYVAAMTSAFAQGQPQVFNDRLVKYRRWLVSNGLAPEVRQAGYETFYNVFQPFVRAMALYAVGLILLGAAWGARSTTAYRSALMLVVLAFALHTTGLVFAIKLAGRPSLMTFAGWAAVLASLVVAWFWRRGVGTAAAAAMAMTVIVAAHRFAPGGAVALFRNGFDITLLGAILVTAAALGAIGVRTRWSRSNSVTRRNGNQTQTRDGVAPLGPRVARRGASV